MTLLPSQAANEPAYTHPICDPCETVSWCSKNGCIPPVREMIAPEVVQAISDLCAAAHTGQGRPL